MTQALPFFGQHSVGELHRMMVRGELSARDIAEQTIAAHARHEPSTLAWVSFDAEALLRQAQRIDDRQVPDSGRAQSLLAMPVGVKDIFNTRDFPTQMGSPLWSGFTPGNDARALFHLQRSGAVVPGKTVTAEFAVHTLGKTLNPYDASRNPGTSSSGSAAAVARGMVPVALGTQTAGSIVRPASFCGVYGMKPSFGLVPRTGMLKTTDSLDTVGFFVAHGQDMVRVWESLRVEGQNYPLSHRALSDGARQADPNTLTSKRAWRVGRVRPHVWGQANAGARVALDDWVQRASTTLGADVIWVEVALPPELEEIHNLHATIYNRALAYYFAEEFKRAELVSPIMNQLIEAGARITPAEYASALDRQSALIRRFDAWWVEQELDAAVTLSTAGSAPLRDVQETVDSALMWTFLHLPSISAPAFKDAAGLPFGLQLLARRYDDPKLLRLLNRLLDSGLLPAHGVMG